MKKFFDEEMRHEVTVAAQPEAIPHLVDFVSSHAREMAFNDTRIKQISGALEEALGNIIRFACAQGDEEIKVTCDAHEMGALVVNIVDSGVPFNMLVVSTFPEIAGDSADPAILPSTKTMKKVVKDIEYRRDGDNRRNILAWVVSK
jgi:anti-sigma regulatory factor (Ser/Thr protein kinase)